MYPLNRKPIPSVHVRAFKRKNTSIPINLGSQEALNVQQRFKTEVINVRQAMAEQVPNGDIDERRRYLAKELFDWSMYPMKKTHKAFYAIIFVTLAIFVISSDSEIPTHWHILIDGLCATTFAWVAYQILSSWRRAYLASSQPNPLQIDHPAIEAKEIESRSGVGVIRPLEIRIAALKHLLAIESAKGSPGKAT